MNSVGQVGVRSYSMGKREKAAARSSELILNATIDLYWQLPIEEITLAMIAERAGVSVQTVIRKFGSRDEVLTAAAERTRTAVEAQRDDARIGDAESIANVLVAHYEEIGDGVLKLLSEESRLAAIADIVDGGRAYHREWCSRVFAPQLDAAPSSRRPRLLLQLVAICDVYTWKLLRRDGGLSRNETTTAIRELIAALEGEVQ